jgi:hypothetical protein
MHSIIKRTLLMYLAAVAIAASLLAGCRGPDVDKPAAGPPAAPDTGTAPAPKSAESSRLPPPASPPTVLAETPPGTVYVCVTDIAGQSRQAAIELQPQVAALCRKAPEMGPCRFERDACRRGGGRAFAVDGTEITPQIEAEYDKRVLRIRMQAN